MGTVFTLIRYEARVQIGLILFLISLYTIFVGDFYAESANTYVAVATAAALDGAILRYQKNKWVWPYSAVVTGFLVGLILNPDFATWQFILVATAAIASKYIILPGKNHVFNPAAFGLVLASFFFDGAVTWWGFSWSPHIWILIFIAAGYVIWRLHRIWLTAGFLVIYWFFSFWQGGLSTSLLIDPTVALFAFIMLPEPQTSPLKGYFRYSFGVLVAAILVIYSILPPQTSTDLLLASLLTANLLSFIVIRYSLNK